MTPVFERAKTVHALDRAATVVGEGIPQLSQNSSRFDAQLRPGNLYHAFIFIKI
jgi:hypothetical protein